MPLVSRSVLCAIVLMGCLGASTSVHACDDRFPGACEPEELAEQEPVPMPRAKPRIRLRAVPFPVPSPLLARGPFETPLLASAWVAQAAEPIDVHNRIETAFRNLAGSHWPSFEYRLRARGEMLQVHRLLAAEGDVPDHIGGQ